jgi:hypothetical protein
VLQFIPEDKMTEEIIKMALEHSDILSLVPKKKVTDDIIRIAVKQNIKDLGFANLNNNVIEEMFQVAKKRKLN